MTMVMLIQSEHWERRLDAGGSPYAPMICAVCGRTVTAKAAQLRVARTNDGEWWVVSEDEDLRADEWHDFQTQADGSRAATILPIGEICLLQRPELRIGLVTITLAEVKAALDVGAGERAAAERTTKRSPRR